MKNLSPKTWTGVEPLELGKTILLEASAGTGKTWQIEGLVVRLVAQYDITIDRILVITFTNAATAELRDRVRKRLVAARDALGEDEEPQGDTILSQIWKDEQTRGKRRTLLATAVSDFDLAPISTIHGFSQRTLDQLAFESGQEPGLELQTNPEKAVQELIQDELANVFARATRSDLQTLKDMGWTQKQLSNLANAMTKAVEPVLEPKPSLNESGQPLGPVECVRLWTNTKNEFRDWLASDAGKSVLGALRAELESKWRRISRLTFGTFEKYLEALFQWLESPAFRSARRNDTAFKTPLKNLGYPHLVASWKGDESDLELFGGAELFRRVTELQDEQDRIWALPLLSFAMRCRGHMDQELKRRGELSYSAMLSRLAERIQEQDGPDGRLACAIRARYDVALIDEFQDTDGAQWPVMRTVFSHPTRRLLIIGDPKQAIYAFRGADVHVYLDAARIANFRATMDTNWRSDPNYIKALNTLWWQDSNAFELNDVDYVNVKSAPGLSPARIRWKDSTSRSALELRWVDGESLGEVDRLISNATIGSAALASYAAAETARLLQGGTEIERKNADDLDGPAWVAIQPGDIAVLVRSNRQATLVAGSLRKLGIPSVSAGRGNVLGSPVLEWICAWLDALASSGRDWQARALATSPLFGWTALDLANAIAAADAASGAELPADQAEVYSKWNFWIQSIVNWGASWTKSGFVQVFEAALDEFAVMTRILGSKDGERHTTDLRHLIELCHAEERRTRIGPSGLATWLRAGRDRAAEESSDEQSLRLESDAHAVQLVTMHSSKGLEYPVVLLPFIGKDFVHKDDGKPMEWHAPSQDANDEPSGHGTELRLNLELAGTEGRNRANVHAARELRQENLRLLYVALTRARHHCVAWFGPIGRGAEDSGTYALGKLALRARDRSGDPLAEHDCPVLPKLGKDSQDGNGQDQVWGVIQDRLMLMAEVSEGTISWHHEQPLAKQTRVRLSAEAPTRIRALAWHRKSELISPWRITSFSSMVTGRKFDASEPQRAEEAQVKTPDNAYPTTEVPVEITLQEPGEIRPDRPDPNSLDSAISTADLRGGTDIGTWAHAVFEHLDFQTQGGQDGSELSGLLSTMGDRYGVRDASDQALLAAAIPGILSTPLDGGRAQIPPGFALGHLLPQNRLDELGFDLRLGSGTRPTEGLAGQYERLNEAGARLALESRLDDPGWGGDIWLRELLLQTKENHSGVLPQMAGILTGFIDLVFRVQDPNVAQESWRYFVADYKTNRIVSKNQRRDSFWRHYTPAWMAWEMTHHGYHLQSLLYTTALHRMLEQRLDNYDYDTHIGGHIYAFLRGMAGDASLRADRSTQSGTALGVFSDRWPASVVLGLDAALKGVATDEIQAIVSAAKAKQEAP